MGIGLTPKTGVWRALSRGPWRNRARQPHPPATRRWCELKASTAVNERQVELLVNPQRELGRANDRRSNTVMALVDVHEN
jgi:hypothetical protein